VQGGQLYWAFPSIRLPCCYCHSFNNQYVVTKFLQHLLQNFSLILPGWPNWTIFGQLGYFYELIMLFQDEVAQTNVDILGNYYILPKRHFQNMVCCRYFKVLKVVWCRCFGLSNWVSPFWGSETVLATFFKNWVTFFRIFRSPWIFHKNECAERRFRL
jgi:hypothetical protein